MKILSVMNNHIEEAEKKDYGYGCTCDNCGTTFIFESSECTKFKTSYELNDFKRIYAE